MNRIRTKRAMKLRISHERALKFTATNTQYMQVVPDSRYNFGSGDFWISYFIQTSVSSIHFQFFNNPQNLFVTTAGATITLSIVTAESALQQAIFDNSAWGSNKNKYWHIVVRRVGGIFSLFVNGSLVSSITFPSTDTLDFSTISSFKIATRDNLTNSFVNGFINNFVVGVGIITNDQVQLIHSLGGVIPSPLRDQVINHWALTQRHYYNDDATGIKVWDTVEQYNHAKATPLTALHGKLVNFTDAEIGADGTVNPASVIDIYTKASYVEAGSEQINEALLLTNAQTITFPSSICDIIGTAKCAIVLTLKFQSANNNYGSVRNILRFVGSTTMYFFVLADGTVRGQNDQVFEWSAALNTPTHFEELHMNGEPGIDTGATNNWSRNGVYQGSVASLSAQDFTGQTLQLKGVDNGLYIARLDVYNFHLTEKEVMRSCDNLLFSDSKAQLLASYRFNSSDFYENGTSVKITDQENGHDGTITGFTGATSADQLADLFTKISDINTLR